MQNLTVIVAVFVAAAAIIAVLFWRIKPQSTANLEAAERRVAEEAGRVQSLQAKLDAGEATLRDALAKAAAAKATAEAANARANDAETNAQQAKAELATLYSNCNVAIEQAATALLHKCRERQKRSIMLGWLHLG